MSPGPTVTRSLTVIEPGPLSTVQDLGRAGLAHLGVPRSGALDTVSAAAANRLVGNDPGDALLEVTAGGCLVRLDMAATVAVTGAPCEVGIDQSPGPHGLAVTVRAGARIRLGPVRAGVRSYLAVAGGLAVPPVLGSRSTDLLSGLGPGVMRAGDVVPVGPPASAACFADVPVLTRLPGPSGVELRLHPGPRLDWFTPAALRRLVDGPWTTTSRSDRTAVGLAGPRLDRAVDRELPSEGLALGSLQVPPAGDPVLFLADHPTTGGYPVIAVVAAADLPLLAQTPPGTPVRLRWARQA